MARAPWLAVGVLACGPAAFEQPPDGTDACPLLLDCPPGSTLSIYRSDGSMVTEFTAELEVEGSAVSITCPGVPPVWTGPGGEQQLLGCTTMFASIEFVGWWPDEVVIGLSTPEGEAWVGAVELEESAPECGCAAVHGSVELVDPE